MGLKDDYSILGIDVDARAEEIKRAFRRQDVEFEWVELESIWCWKTTKKKDLSDEENQNRRCCWHGARS